MCHQLTEDPKVSALSIESLLVERYKNAGITKVVGTEARGFLFGARWLRFAGRVGLFRYVNRANYRVKLLPRPAN